MASRLVLTDACVCVCVSLSLFSSGHLFWRGSSAPPPRPLPPPLSIRGSGWGPPGGCKERTCLSCRVLFPAGAGCSELLRTQTFQDSKSGVHVVCFCSVLGDLEAASVTSSCRDATFFSPPSFSLPPPLLSCFIVAQLEQTFGALSGGPWWGERRA